MYCITFKINQFILLITMKNYLIKTSEITYKFYRVEANSIKEAEEKIFSSKDKINTLKTAQVIDSINEL